jgi:hypothetical protein
MQLTSGTVFPFVFLLLSFAIFYVFMRRALQGKVRKMRSLAALQAIPESIGKAAETNRPVHFNPGTVGFSGAVAGNAAQTFAGLSVLSYVAKLTAKYKVPLYVTLSYGELIPVVESIAREAYASENRADAVSRETHILYFPVAISNAPFVSGVLGLFERVKPAANIMIGGAYYESLAISEQGYVIGAIQIAGTAMVSQIPFFVAACDYTLIGEEIFVAGAVVSQDATILGSIVGEDLLKIILLAMLIGGFLLQNLGFNWTAIMAS